MVSLYIYIYMTRLPLFFCRECSVDELLRFEWFIFIRSVTILVSLGSLLVFLFSNRSPYIICYSIWLCIGIHPIYAYESAEKHKSNREKINFRNMFVIIGSHVRFWLFVLAFGFCRFYFHFIRSFGFSVVLNFSVFHFSIENVVIVRNLCLLVLFRGPRNTFDAMMNGEIMNV